MKQGWITDKFGDSHHYVDGKLHSINDEPATIYLGGSKVWYKEGLRHRESDPAVIWYNGVKAYWFEDKYYPEITSDLEWLMKVEELKRT